MTTNEITKFLAKMLLAKSEGELVETRRTQWGIFIKDRCGDTVEITFEDRDNIKGVFNIMGKKIEGKVKIENNKDAIAYSQIMNMICA